MRVKHRFAQSQSDVIVEQKRGLPAEKPQKTAWMLRISESSNCDCTDSESPGCE
jgi:hypothetical protein